MSGKFNRLYERLRDVRHIYRWQILVQRRQFYLRVRHLVILDNAKMHKSRAVKRFLKQHPWVALEHLEPYSPEYNPIERFWQWLKAKVCSGQKGR